MNIHIFTSHIGWMKTKNTNTKLHVRKSLEIKQNWLSSIVKKISDNELFLFLDKNRHTQIK